MHKQGKASGQSNFLQAALTQTATEQRGLSTKKKKILSLHFIPSQDVLKECSTSCSNEEK